MRTGRILVAAVGQSEATAAIAGRLPAFSEKHLKLPVIKPFYIDPREIRTLIAWRVLRRLRYDRRNPERDDEHPQAGG